MQIEPDEVIRIITRIVGLNNTLYANTFYLQNREVSAVLDSAALDDVDTWLSAMFGTVEPGMDSQDIEQEAQVDLVEVTGVYDPDPELNTAKVSVIRPIGFVNGFFTGGSTGEEYSGIVTGVLTPATNVARTRSRKSLSGWTEGALIQGLFDNTNFSRLVQFGAYWVAGPVAAGVSTQWGAGTLSLRLGIFAGYTGSFTVTNVPGSQVTRKIGRGA